MSAVTVQYRTLPNARRALAVDLASAGRRYDAAVALALGNAARAERAAWNAYYAAAEHAKSVARARRDAWQRVHGTDSSDLLVLLDRQAVILGAHYAPFATPGQLADARQLQRMIGTELDRRGVRQ